MSTKLNRRQVLTSSAIALTAAYCARAEEAAPSAAPKAASTAPAGKTLTIKKCLKFGMFKEEGLSLQEKFQVLKDLGFDGVELDSPSQLDREEVMAARDASGLEIPGMISKLQWDKPLSDPSQTIRDEGRRGLETALRDAAYYGATTVLLVPAVVKKDVQYDVAWTSSQREIRKALSVAREVGVKIAIENVWNSFLFSPLEMARYVDELNDPMVGVYLDVGNTVNFGWPEHWIRILGRRILKLDIKEYSRMKRDQEGPYAGFRIPLGRGDCDWPTVVKALQEIGYSGGWGSAEVRGGDRQRLKEISEAMDRILPTLH